METKTCKFDELGLIFSLEMSRQVYLQTQTLPETQNTFKSTNSKCVHCSVKTINLSQFLCLIDYGPWTK